MQRFMLFLVAVAAGASPLVWTNAVAQTDGPRITSAGYRHAFAAVSGGHYFGEDESEAVKRLSPNELYARLSYGTESFRRAQAKGQVAQLRDRLDAGTVLTPQQAQLMEQILIAERDRWAQEVTEQYAGRVISASISSWTGMITLASDELGGPRSTATRAPARKPMRAPSN